MYSEILLNISSTFFRYNPNGLWILSGLVLFKAQISGSVHKVHLTHNRFFFFHLAASYANPEKFIRFTIVIVSTLFHLRNKTRLTAMEALCSSEDLKEQFQAK